MVAHPRALWPHVAPPAHPPPRALSSNDAQARPVGASGDDKDGGGVRDIEVSPTGAPLCRYDTEPFRIYPGLNGWTSMAGEACLATTG